MSSLLNMSGGSLLNKGLPYDYEVEYLESNTQDTKKTFIDTSYSVSTYDEIYGIFAALGRFSSNGHLFFGQGVSYNNRNIDMFSSYDAGNKFSCCLNGYKDVGQITLGSKFNVTFKNKIYTILNENGTVNGVADYRNEQDFTARYTMRIFSINRGTHGSSSQPVRCYLFQIKNSLGDLVCDLIPVVDKQGVGCMYDKVSKQLFYNQGTGSFIAGPRVS